MGTVPNTVLIVEKEIEMALSKDNTIEENAKIAFKQALNHWLAPPEREAWEAATLALGMIHKDTLDFERLEQECKVVNAMFMTPTNVPVDYLALSESLKDIKSIGLIKIWKDAKNGD